MNVIWYGRMVSKFMLLKWDTYLPASGINSLSSHQRLSSSMPTFVRAESCQEQKQKQLLAVVSMFVVVNLDIKEETVATPKIHQNLAMFRSMVCFIC